MTLDPRVLAWLQPNIGTIPRRSWAEWCSEQRLTMWGPAWLVQGRLVPNLRHEAWGTARGPGSRVPRRGLRKCSLPLEPAFTSRFFRRQPLRNFAHVLYCQKLISNSQLLGGPIWLQSWLKSAILSDHFSCFSCLRFHYIFLYTFSMTMFQTYIVL